MVWKSLFHYHRNMLIKFFVSFFFLVSCRVNFYKTTRQFMFNFGFYNPIDFSEPKEKKSFQPETKKTSKCTNLVFLVSILKQADATLFNLLSFKRICNQLTENSFFFFSNSNTIYGPAKQQNIPSTLVWLLVCCCFFFSRWFLFTFSNMAINVEFYWIWLKINLYATPHYFYKTNKIEICNWECCFTWCLCVLRTAHQPTDGIFDGNDRILFLISLIFYIHSLITHIKHETWSGDSVN